VANRSPCALALAGAALVAILASLPAAAVAQNPFDRPRAPLSRQCTFNGDCAAGLICEGGFCRAECQSDRDCSGDKICLDGLYSAQGQLLHLGRPSHPVAATSLTPANPGAYYAARCQARAAQPAGTPARSNAPVITGPVVPAPLVVTGVALAANPAQVSAKCPATVTFNGWIGASAPGAVTYRTLRSDGATSAPQVLKFETGGQKKLSLAWTLGQSAKGSISIEVLAPNRMTSPPAQFSLDCAG
jgi:hypothetical protein